MELNKSDFHDSVRKISDRKKHSRKQPYTKIRRNPRRKSRSEDVELNFLLEEEEEIIQEQKEDELYQYNQIQKQIDNWKGEDQDEEENEEKEEYQMKEEIDIKEETLDFANNEYEDQISEDVRKEFENDFYSENENHENKYENYNHEKDNKNCEKESENSKKNDEKDNNESYEKGESCEDERYEKKNENCGKENGNCEKDNGNCEKESKDNENMEVENNKYSTPLLIQHTKSLTIQQINEQSQRNAPQITNQQATIQQIDYQTLANSLIQYNVIPITVSQPLAFTTLPLTQSLSLATLPSTSNCQYPIAISIPTKNILKPIETQQNLLSKKINDKQREKNKSNYISKDIDKFINHLNGDANVHISKFKKDCNYKLNDIKNIPQSETITKRSGKYKVIVCEQVLQNDAFKYVPVNELHLIQLQSYDNLKNKFGIEYGKDINAKNIYLCNRFQEEVCFSSMLHTKQNIDIRIKNYIDNEIKLHFITTDDFTISKKITFVFQISKSNVKKESFSKLQQDIMYTSMHYTAETVSDPIMLHKLIFRESLKKMLSLFSKKHLDNEKKINDPIHKKLSINRYTSRCGAKLLNINHILGHPIDTLFFNRQIVYFLDLCAAPGVFSQVLQDISSFYTNIKVKGITQSIEISNMKIEEVHLQNTKNFETSICYSDITTIIGRNIISERLKELNIKKVDFILADGGFNNKGYEEYDEQLVLPLYIGEIITCLQHLAKGGFFLMKLFDTHLKISVQLLSILRQVFENISIIKPLMSRTANAEKYFFGYGFRYKTNMTEIITKLEDIIKILNNKDENKLISILSETPENFKSWMDEINRVYINNQCESLYTYINLLKKNEKELPSLLENVKYSLKCHEYLDKHVKNKWLNIYSNYGNMTLPMD